MVTATLNKLRNHFIKQSDAYLESPAETVRVDTNHLCLKKGPEGQQVLFCINNKSSVGDNYQLVMEGFQPGERVVEVLECAATTADGVGSFTSFQYDGEPKVYVSESSLKGSGLCPETTEAGPRNAASGLRAVSGLLVAVTAGWIALFLA